MLSGDEFYDEDETSGILLDTSDDEVEDEVEMEPYEPSPYDGTFFEDDGE